MILGTYPPLTLHALLLLNFFKLKLQFKKDLSGTLSVSSCLDPDQDSIL